MYTLVYDDIQCQLNSALGAVAHRILEMMKYLAIYYCLARGHFD